MQRDSTGRCFVRYCSWMEMYVFLWCFVFNFVHERGFECVSLTQVYRHPQGVIAWCVWQESAQTWQLAHTWANSVLSFMHDAKSEPRFSKEAEDVSLLTLTMVHTTVVHWPKGDLSFCELGKGSSYKYETANRRQAVLSISPFSVWRSRYETFIASALRPSSTSSQNQPNQIQNKTPTLI